MNKIKFIHKDDTCIDIKVVGADLTLWELLDRFKEFCACVGFHPECIERIQYVEESDEKTN